MPDTATSTRPTRGASPAQDADTARRLAEQAEDLSKIGGDRDRAQVLATAATAYAQLSQASLLSAILNELRGQAEDAADARRLTRGSA